MTPTDARPIRVVKLGGRAQAAPDLAARLATAARTARLVVVHGGGDEVTALQRQMGVEPVFVHGRRVTRAEDLDAVRMVLSGTVNKRLVAQALGAGLRAVGISGEDGGLLTARVTDPTYGRVGREVRAESALIADLLAAGWTPFVSPLARDLFVSDVPGVLDAGAPVSALDAAGVADLVARGVVQGGMRAKLEAALVTLAAGVGRVRIATLDGLDHPDAGTSLLTRSL